MKILIIRLSSIGDIVLTTPLLRCISQQMPGAEIHYLTKESFIPLLEHNPYINKIISYTSDNIKLLGRENYDHITDLHKNIRTLALRLSLRKPVSSFPKLNIRKWLLVNFKINTLPDIHIVDRYFKSLKKFGVVNDGEGLDFFFGDDDNKALEILPENYSDAFIAISCGSLHATKQMPESLISKIIETSPLPIVLLGGKEDTALAERICGKHSEKAFNACGKLSIRQSAWLLYASKAVIAADTGLMHIAAALKKRIVSVWGNTIPGFGMYPYLPDDLRHLSSIVEVDSLKCRPCSKLGFEKCPKKHFDCMKLHNPERIIELAMHH